jgi:hypothetical protein
VIALRSRRQRAISSHAGAAALVPHRRLVPTYSLAQTLTASHTVHSLIFLLHSSSLALLALLAEVPPSHRGPPEKFSRLSESVKIRNGLVSTIHATLISIVVLAWFAFYSFEPWNYQRNMQGGFVSEGNSNGDAWYPEAICFTLGYFMYDTLCMMYYNRYIGNTGSYIHHIVIGSAFGVGVYTGMGRTYHFIFLLEELSTPALNFKNLYRDSPNAYKLWSYIFVGTFLFIRGIYGLGISTTTYYCLYQYYFANSAQMDTYYFGGMVTVCGGAFTVSRLLNVYWIGLIVGKIRQELNPKPRKEKKVL